MELAIMGLGRMGANMVRRLLRDGHRVVAYNRSPDPVKEAEQEGAVGAYSIEEAVHELSAPRVIWMMIPAGDPVDTMIDSLLPLLSPGDVLIDGGNSNWKDSVRRAEKVKAHDIHYLDVGTSGGIWGLEVGYCLMIGGEKTAFKMVEPAFKSLAPEDGYQLVGPSGAGHFAKMIHNGIEYGLMQAYAEGYELLTRAELVTDAPAVLRSWRDGSVIRSWLLDLLDRALADDPKLAEVRAYVEDTGEGRWVVEEAVRRAVPIPALTAALFTRFSSRQSDRLAMKAVAALREQFGGHPIRR